MAEIYVDIDAVEYILVTRNEMKRARVDADKGKEPTIPYSSANLSNSCHPLAYDNLELGAKAEVRRESSVFVNVVREGVVEFLLALEACAVPIS